MDGSIFFSVGEPSGDLHAANLVRELNRFQPNLACRGLGGMKMAEAGVSIDFDLTQLAVVGLVEVLPKLREFFRVADLAEEIFRKERPRAVVLVDFPGFNWHIAKRAKKLGIPVIYYLPPQLWAWGAWRLAKMRRTVDHILCNLPFEPQWYAQRGVHVDYVGHPFFDEVASKQLDTEVTSRFAADPALKVAVLPGSRTREVEKIWPMQLEIIRQMSAKHPQAKFLIAAYKEAHRKRCEERLSDQDKQLPIEFFIGKTSELIEIADCALMKSGSVSLEMMARGTPAVVLYHASRTLYAAARCMTKLKSITLPNMIAGKVVMPEFLAVGSSTVAMHEAAAALDRMLADDAYRTAKRCELEELCSQFAQPGASRNAAERISQILSSQSLRAA